MMMAELPLGLSMLLGRNAAPLAHLVKKIDDVTNVTTVLGETTASDPVSCTEWQRRTSSKEPYI